MGFEQMIVGRFLKIGQKRRLTFVILSFKYIPWQVNRSQINSNQLR